MVPIQQIASLFMDWSRPEGAFVQASFDGLPMDAKIFDVRLASPEMGGKDIWIFLSHSTFVPVPHGECIPEVRATLRTFFPPRCYSPEEAVTVARLFNRRDDDNKAADMIDILVNA